MMTDLSDSVQSNLKRVGAQGQGCKLEPNNSQQRGGKTATVKSAKPPQCMCNHFDPHLGLGREASEFLRTWVVGTLSDAEASLPCSGCTGDRLTPELPFSESMGRMGLSGDTLGTPSGSGKFEENHMLCNIIYAELCMFIK